MMGRFSHRALDPRAKLAFAIAVSVVAIAIPRLESLVALALVMATTVAIGRGFGIRAWLATLTPFKVLVPIIVVLNTFFYADGVVLWAIPGLPIAVTVGGLQTSAVIAARLLVVASVASWFAATTDPEAFEVALVKLGVPWGFAFLLSLTLRLVPEMRIRFAEIEEAQRSRGLAIEGGPLRRARARLPMLVPFLASVIQHGYELGEALEARDFGMSSQRTSLVQLSHSRMDYALYLASLAVVGAFVAAFVV